MGADESDVDALGDAARVIVEVNARDVLVALHRYFDVGLHNSLACFFNAAVNLKDALIAVH